MYYKRKLQEISHQNDVCIQGSHNDCYINKAKPRSAIIHICDLSYIHNVRWRVEIDLDIPSDKGDRFMTLVNVRAVFNMTDKAQHPPPLPPLACTPGGGGAQGMRKQIEYGLQSGSISGHLIHSQGQMAAKHW